MFVGKPKLSGDFKLFYFRYSNQKSVSQPLDSEFKGARHVSKDDIES